MRLAREKKNKDWAERLAYYYKNGFISQSLVDENPRIRLEALDYFLECKKVLEMDTIPTEFTREQAILLNFNNILVNNRAILSN